MEVPVDQQRLIFKGRILKDDDSMGSYGEDWMSGRLRMRKNEAEWG